MVIKSGSQEMVFRTIACFNANGVLDIAGLDRILEAALEDGVMDHEERKVLKSIIYNLTSRDLTPEMWDRVELLIERYELDDVS